MVKPTREFKVNNFDLLRLLAATQVIVDHYIEHYNIKLTNFKTELLYLFPGVPVFFIISGYLISASYERNNNLKVYFKNRVLRIYPGLWACIFITIIVFSITGVSFFNKQVLTWLPAQLAGFIYTPSFLANYGFGSYNGSLWTIPLELQFYILLLFIFLVFGKGKLNYWLYALLLFFAAASCIYGVSNLSVLVNKLLRYTFIPHLYLFLIGVILQRWRIYQSPFIYNKAIYWIPGYVLICLLLPGAMNPIIFTTITNFILAFCILSMAYTLPNLANKLLRNNDISYGIYIYHGLILTVAIQEKLTISIYLLIFITYIIAYFSWRLVEKPFILIKEKTIRKV